MNQVAFDQIVENIKRDAHRIAKEYSQSGGLPTGNFVDIDKFLDVIYNLLVSGNYVLDVTASDNAQHPEKFYYTEEYPDSKAEDKNIVTFGIDRREPASLSAGREPFSGIKNYRPFYMGESPDRAEGNRAIHCSTMYDNMIEFICWSPKLSNARRMATLFEGLMQKYYWVLRQHVPLFIYQGRSKVKMDKFNGEMRYFGIPLYYFVRTSDMFTIEEQEIRNINLDIKK